MPKNPSRPKGPPAGPEVSRRGFLRGIGAAAGAAAVGVPALAPQEAAAKVLGPGATTVTLQVNGVSKTLEAEPRVTLLNALRNHLDLTGT